MNKKKGIIFTHIQRTESEEGDTDQAGEGTPQERRPREQTPQEAGRPAEPAENPPNFQRL